MGNIKDMAIETLKSTRERAIASHQRDLLRMEKEEEILALLPDDFPATKVFAHNLFGRVAKVSAQVDYRANVQELWNILPGIPLAIYKGGGTFFTYEFWAQEEESRKERYSDVTPAGNFIWEYEGWAHRPSEPDRNVIWFAELSNKEMVEVEVRVLKDPARAEAKYNRYQANRYSYFQYDFPPGMRVEYSRVEPKAPGQFKVYQPHGVWGPETITCPADLFTPGWREGVYDNVNQ